VEQPAQGGPLAHKWLVAAVRRELDLAVRVVREVAETEREEPDRDEEEETTATRDAEVLLRVGAHVRELLDRSVFVESAGHLC